MTETGSGGITRRNVLKAAGVGAVGTVALTGTASANCEGPCEPVTLGKIEGGQLPACDETTTVTLTLDGDLRSDDSDCQGDKDVDVMVTATECKDGSEVTCVELEIVDDNGACKCADDGLYLSGARVKAGPTLTEYDCDDVENKNQEYSKLPGACAAINPANGKRYGISHIDVLVCVFPGDKDTEDCAKSGGG